MPENEVEAEEVEQVLQPEEDSTYLAEILRKTPWWAISVAFHAVILLVLWKLNFGIGGPKRVEVEIVARLEKKEEPEYDPEKPRDIMKKTPLTETDSDIDAPLIETEITEFDDHFETDDNMELSETARGFENAMGLEDAGSIGVIGGPRGGGGGRYGFRNGGGKKRAVARGGGGKATEDAVDAALRWLARHQEYDGHWDVKKHGGFGNVSGGICMSDTAVSGLAVLAFLGAGHTHKTGKYKNNVDRAVKWLISQQLPSGAFIRDRSGYEVYDHTIGALALSEAYGMSRDKRVGKAAQSAIDYVQKIQEPNAGWHHGGFRSTSVLGWAVMALKSARIAGLDVNSEAFEGAMNRLREVTDQDDYGKVGYTKKGQYSYAKGFAMTSVGMVSYMFLGLAPTDPLIQMQADMLIQKPPEWQPQCNVSDMQYFYHWYYATLGMFQAGGDYWKIWNKALKKTLLPNQRKGGDEDGSWDHSAGWGRVGGRVYSTAMGALCLEVYYRYLPMYMYK